MQPVAFPLTAIISAILLITVLAVDSVQRKLAQRPRLENALLVVLLCAVWCSQVAICLVQKESLWLYGLAVVCGWAALAHFYWIRRFFVILLLHGAGPALSGVFVAILVTQGDPTAASEVGSFLSQGTLLGSLFSFPFSTMILLWRWGRNVDTSLGWWSRNTRRTLGCLVAMALPLIMGYGLWDALANRIEDGRFWGRILKRGLFRQH